jgi:twitching motility protein PilT
MSTAAEASLLGRIALHYKLVTQEQLQEALRTQTAQGGAKTPLGDILMEMNVISQDQLTWLLNAQAQMEKKQAAAAAQSAPAAAAPAAAAPIAAPAPSASPAPAPRPSRPAAPAAAPLAPLSGPLSLESILARAMEARASDVHIHSGAPAQLRINGYFKDLKLGTLDAATAESLLFAALTDDQRKAVREHQDLDFAIQLPMGRFRANIYKQQRGWDGVFRPIPQKPPTLEELGLPPTLKRLTDWHQGLVLVTGPAGCGKSSTLAALVNMVNASRKEHIITVEDPIEYVHPSKRCVVNQRQAGLHTRSFANALRAALREDPDVIVIGELRDLETVSLAITAAETGHLVLGTLHTNSAIRTINRILDVFPPKQQSQIRAMVSESLKAIVSQRLVPTADGTRRVPATEVLFVKPSVSNLIRDEKTFQIRSVMQTGRSEGMALLDDSLADLVKAGTVTREMARRFCEDPKRFS